MSSFYPKDAKIVAKPLRMLPSAKHTKKLDIPARCTLYNPDKSSSAQYQCGGHATCYERRHRAFRGHAQRPEWDQDYLVGFDNCK